MNRLYIMARVKHSRRRVHRRRSAKINGGNGAAEHAINTYGGIGQQHAVSDTNHTIAINTGAGIVPAVVKGGAQLTPALVTGGAELTPAIVTGGAELVTVGGEEIAEVSNGGGIITDIALPAALIYTRNLVSKRRIPTFSMRKSRRYNRRGSRRRGRGRR
jgi:hypothetical protein